MFNTFDSPALMRGMSSSLSRDTLSFQAPRSRVSEDHVDSPIDAVAQAASLFRPM